MSSQPQSQLYQKRYFSRIDSLYLTPTQDLDDGNPNWVDILRARSWSSIKRVCMDYLDVDDDNIEVLLECGMDLLEVLRLSFVSLTARGLLKMQAMNLQNMKVLCLDGCSELRASGMNALAKLQMPNLENIRLNHVNCENTGLRCLTKNRWFQLKKLELNQNIAEILAMESITTHPCTDLDSLEIGRKWISAEQHNKSRDLINSLMLVCAPFARNIGTRNLYLGYRYQNSALGKKIAYIYTQICIN